MGEYIMSGIIFPEALYYTNAILYSVNKEIIKNNTSDDESDPDEYQI